MKRGLVGGLVVILVLVFWGLGIYFYFSGEGSDSLNCAGQGELWDAGDDSYPNSCCEGLTTVSSAGGISVADECYWKGMDSGYPGGICSDCGNRICESAESVCGCSEDCVGQDKSDYETIEEFCSSSDYELYCDRDFSEGFELDLCDLCS